MTTTTKKTSTRRSAKSAAEFDAGKVADAARAQVQRAAAAAKTHADDVYEGAAKFNSSLETTMSRILTGYVGVLGEVTEATRANFVTAMDAVEKIAQAKDLTEAARIQADFVRENATANFDRVRNVASATRDVMTEGAEALREGAAGMWPLGRKAA